MSLPWEKDESLLTVDGQRYVISLHATERAEQMGVPLTLFEPIIRNGAWFEPHRYSKHQNSLMVRNGKVGLGISYGEHLPVIATCVWATVEAWRDYEHRGGRVYKGDEWTRLALDSWTPIPSITGATRGAAPTPRRPKPTGPYQKRKGPNE